MAVRALAGTAALLASPAVAADGEITGQYSGTARPEVMKRVGQDPWRLALDGAAAGGPKVDAEFTAPSSGSSPPPAEARPSPAA